MGWFFVFLTQYICLFAKFLVCLMCKTLKNNIMGTVDIKKELARFELDERIMYDESIPFKEFSDLIKDVITEVTERYYEMGEDEGEIEDWDMWEMDVITECNNRVEKLLVS